MVAVQRVEARLEQDQDAESPRSTWDNTGKMYYYHNRYKLGDEKLSPEQLQYKFHQHHQRGDIVLPVYLYDHGVQVLSTQSFIGRAHHAEWDSGRVGFIVAPLGKLRQEHGWKRITPKRRRMVEEWLRQEVEDYSLWMSGNVYTATVELVTYDEGWGELEREHLDSYSGLYGYENACQEAKALAAEYADDHGVEHVFFDI